jgi:hypothetical protein
VRASRVNKGPASKTLSYADCNPFEESLNNRFIVRIGTSLGSPHHIRRHATLGVLAGLAESEEKSAITGMPSCGKRIALRGNGLTTEFQARALRQTGGTNFDKVNFSRPKPLNIPLRQSLSDANG